jgi:ParB-like nuclease family protein
MADYRTTNLVGEDCPIEKLMPSSRNARTHTPKQIEKITESIKRFGFIGFVLADAARRIVAGHGRLEAAKMLGFTSVPVLRIEHLSNTELRAYAIADNRLAELSGWDSDLLKLELGELALELPELDLTITGFETPDLDLILLGNKENEMQAASKAGALPSSREVPVVSRPGDIWQLGPHRLLCGAPDDASAVLEGRLARYADEAVKQFQRFTDIEARHALTGRTFAEEARHRAEEDGRRGAAATQDENTVGAP